MDPEPEPAPEEEFFSAPSSPAASPAAPAASPAPEPVFWASQGLQQASNLPVAPGWLRAKAVGGLRVYSVWSLPGHPELEGIWIGSATSKSAWWALTPLLRNQKYAGSGARLKAYPELDEAIRQWGREGPRACHGRPVLGFFYHV